MGVYRTFLFNSGGRYLSDGEGEWDIILDGDGRISITHFMGDDILFTGMSMLEERSDELWSIIEKILERPPSDTDSTETGDKDIRIYTFSYKDDGREVTFKIRSDKSGEFGPIGDFLEKIAQIVEIITGKRPKF